MNRPKTVSDARSLAEGLLAAGLTSVDPRQKVAEWLSTDAGLLDEREPVVIAVGKAATAMAHGAADILGNRIRSGIILTKDGHAAAAPDGFTVYEAAHPVPDQRGLDATTAILRTVDVLDRDDVVLTLLSGGGSALLELPRPPLTLADLQEMTSLLLRAGAPIQHLNAVRSELSQVKGGGLRRRMGEAQCVTLIMSDVLGNDLQVIASGPTVHRRPNPKEALRLLDQYRLTGNAPRSVLDVLHQEHAGDDRTDLDPERDVFRILADNDVFLDAIQAEAERRGLRTAIAWRQQEGEARELAVRFVHRVTRSSDDIDLVIGGGEATVTVTGSGSGGRNTEFTLAAGLQLAEVLGGAGWAAGSMASDGQDGSVDACGALTSAGSIRHAMDKGLDPKAALAENDSGGYFRNTGELIRTGPTGTNVNDVSIAVRLTS